MDGYEVDAMGIPREPRGQNDFRLQREVPRSVRNRGDQQRAEFMRRQNMIQTFRRKPGGGMEEVRAEPPRNAKADRGGVRRQPMTRLEQEAESLSMEELRQKADEESKAENWKQFGPQVFERICAVLEHYPWYKDSKKNGEIIAQRLGSAEAIQQRRREHRADNDYSLLEIAAVVEAAAAQGQLDINEAGAAEQRIETYKEQLASLPRTEAETNKIDMNKLRQLADRHVDILGD